MNKTIALLLSIFSIFLFSCSSEEPDAPQEMYPETQFIKTIPNADGTYYALDSDCVSLRKANGAVISYLHYDFPEAYAVDMPYGQKESHYYRIIDFYKYEDDVVLVFLADDSKNSTTYTEIGDQLVGIAYIYDSKITSCAQKNFLHGLAYHLDDEYAIVSSDCSIHVYDLLFNYSHKIEKPDGIMPSRPSQRNGAREPAFGKLNGCYYLMGDGNVSYTTDQQDAIIVDYARHTTYLIYKPDRYCIVHDFLPEEGAHYPRFDNNSYSFVEDHFEISYPYVTYGGDRGSVSYKYDVEGNQIFPLYTPHLGFTRTSATGFIGRELFDVLGYEAPDEIDYVIQCDSKAGFYAEKAKLYKYDRPFDVDFSMASSNPDIIEVVETSSETNLNNSGHSYSLVAKSVGDVDLLFSTPGYENILSYHVRVDTYSNIHKNK